MAIVSAVILAQIGGGVDNFSESFSFFFSEKMKIFQAWGDLPMVPPIIASLAIVMSTRDVYL